MPSDPLVDRALGMLAPAIAQYRSAIATTLEQVRGHLAAGRSDAAARAQRLHEQLGPFADGRIDATRLAGLLGDRHVLDPLALQRLERASRVLWGLLEDGNRLFQVTLAPGDDFPAPVSRQLATIGRAFAAARVASAAHNGGAASGLDEDVALDSFPFSRWNAAERQLSPPLVVAVHGADLNAGALAPFVDGGQKILLIVEGPCSPAPLVRLITPGVLVMETHDLGELERIASWPGAAVGALVPASSMRFVHDPAAGPELWRRLSVQGVPEPRIGRLGGFSPAQQIEELRQLEALAARPPASGGEAASSPAGAADPVDRLAAWLLHQATLPAAVSAE